LTEANEHEPFCLLTRRSIKNNNKYEIFDAERCYNIKGYGPMKKYSLLSIICFYFSIFVSLILIYDIFFIAFGPFFDEFYFLDYTFFQILYLVAPIAPITSLVTDILQKKNKTLSIISLFSILVPLTILIAIGMSI